MMNRRQALIAMMSAMGLAGTAQVFGATRLLAASTPAGNARPLFTTDQIHLLDEIAETIVPETPGSPGAKAAQVGRFMQEIVSDYYSREEQEVFLQGIPQLHQHSTAMHGHEFTALDKQQRQALLLALAGNPEAQYFTMMKQLTVWGYFSSEVGVTKALRFAPIPGRYDGDVKIKPGTRAWADIGS